MRGSPVDAKGNLTLAANGAITLAAAEEEDRQSGNARSSLGKLSPPVSIGASAANSNYTGTKITTVEGVLTAAGVAKLTTSAALGWTGRSSRAGGSG